MEQVGPFTLISNKTTTESVLDICVYKLFWIRNDFFLDLMERVAHCHSRRKEQKIENRSSLKLRLVIVLGVANVANA